MVPRLPRFKRQPDFARQFRATERDLSILRAVATHRFLTSRHIQMLVPGSTQQILRRLQLLFHHGYLTRPLAQLRDTQRKNLPLVYGLGAKGAKLLGLESDWGTKNREAKSLFLKHTLLIADIMVGIQVACRKSAQFKLIPQSDILSNAGNGHQKPKPGWHVSFRHNGSNHRVGILPDQIFGLKADGKEVEWFFLEADRGTMPIQRKTLKQTSIIKKIMGYHHSAEQRIPWHRFRIPLFRVICVSHSKSRLRGIREATSGFKNGFLTVHANSFGCGTCLNDTLGIL